MKIITQKSQCRLKIKRKRSDLMVTEVNAALCWELDCREVYHERY